jgi:hypothetical protein
MVMEYIKDGNLRKFLTNNHNQLKFINKLNLLKNLAFRLELIHEQDLVQNWENISEVEIEFEEKDDGFKVYKKVVSFWTPQSRIVV